MRSNFIETSRESTPDLPLVDVSFTTIMQDEALQLVALYDSFGYGCEWYPEELARLANRSLSATAGKKTPQGEERSRHMNGITEGNLITDGNSRAVVVAATSAFLICEPENGGTEFVLNAESFANSWSAVGVEAPALTIERPFVVYRTDGTRVDGYRYESRARRLNAERCAGEGYFIAKLDPSTFEFVPA